MTTNYNRRFKHDISEQLAHIRKVRRQPLFEVAKGSGISPELIDKLECGGRQISWKSYYQLMSYYHCKIILIDA
ncbi:MAG: hypothetical protein IJ660_01240 [Alphaproteobacteria bacterium]|nr:hypothetical protein [Alphaproteobacteria bacterium]